MKNHTFCKKKGKGKFLYSAVSSPQDRSKRFTLYFPGRPVHSDTISASLGSIHTYATINVRRLLVPTTVYSFIQLSELEQCRVKKNLPNVLTPQHMIRSSTPEPLRSTGRFVICKSLCITMYQPGCAGSR